MSSLILPLKRRRTVCAHCSFYLSEYSPTKNSSHHKCYQGDGGKRIICFHILQFWGNINEPSCQPDGSVTKHCSLAALFFFSSDPLLIYINKPNLWLVNCFETILLSQSYFTQTFKMMSALQPASFTHSICFFYWLKVMKHTDSLKQQWEKGDCSSSNAVKGNMSVHGAYSFHS